MTKSFFRSFLSSELGAGDRWLGRIALGVAVLTAGHLIYNYVTNPSGVPVIMDRVEVLNDPVTAGDGLRVRIYRDKLRDDCPVDSDRFAINYTGQVYVLEGRTWEGGPLDTRYLEYEYPIPRTLPAGNYILRVRLTYLCPEETYLIEQPDATFEVVQVE